MLRHPARQGKHEGALHLAGLVVRQRYICVRAQLAGIVRRGARLSTPPRIHQTGTGLMVANASKQTIEKYFVCVGAQKAGTTWLARTLANHPDLFVTPVKEIHYFDHVQGITQHLHDKKRRSRYRKYHQRMWTQWSSFAAHRRQRNWYRSYMQSPIDDDWYRRLFEARDGARFAGEATPEYAILGPSGLARIRNLAPDARVIYIMRNPVTRAWSQILHLCRSYGLDAAATEPDKLWKLLDEPRFSEMGDYARTLTDLQEVFRREQLCFMFYEEVHRDRPAALEKICDFIGADFRGAWFANTAKRFNTSQGVALSDDLRHNLAMRYRQQAERVGALCGALPDNWRREFGL